MATPNYSFIKRQKDLAKKAKKEEKKQAKLRGDAVGEADEVSVAQPHNLAEVTPEPAKAPEKL
jgi:hypothetical protein